MSSFGDFHSKAFGKGKFRFHDTKYHRQPKSSKPIQINHSQTLTTFPLQLSTSDRTITLQMESEYNDLEPLSLSPLPCNSPSVLGNQGCSCETCTESCQVNAADGYYHSAGVCAMYRYFMNTFIRFCPQWAKLSIS